MDNQKLSIYTRNKRKDGNTIYGSTKRSIIHVVAQLLPPNKMKYLKNFCKNAVTQLVTEPKFKLAVVI
jgi:hypothetical protein